MDPPPRTRLVAAGLVRDGRVLLGRRSARRASHPGVWDLPGGHVEPHETWEEAIRRELHEELGIRVEVGPPLVRLAPADVAVEMAVWRIERWVGRIVNAAPDEHDELAWVTPSEAAGLPLAHASYRELLASLVRDEPPSGAGDPP